MRHAFNATKDLHRALQYIACNAGIGIREKSEIEHWGRRG
jgi:hypothetical protein